MNPKIYFVLMILIFLALDLSSSIDTLHCYKCSQKCKAAGKTAVSCNFEIGNVMGCFSKFDSQSSTDGAVRGCQSRLWFKDRQDGCTEENICYCFKDGCNDKDSYNGQSGGKDKIPKPPSDSKDQTDTGDNDGVSRISSNLVFILTLIVCLIIFK